MMAGGHMWVLDNWVEVGCAVSDQVRARDHGVSSSLSDHFGKFGPPVIYTEWIGANGEPILRDYSDPARIAPCRHYVPGSEGG